MSETISWFEAIVLGLVQGLTEFIPVSSSAHILIVSQLFGWQDPGAAFTAVTQIGTELAVVIYFAKDLWRIATTWLRSLVTPDLRSNADAKMGWYIIIGTIPIVVLGISFADYIETAARNLWLVAGTLIGFGIILGLADRFGRKTKTLESLTIRSGLAYGFGQALALVPGVSRSGATLSVGLVMGYTRAAATRYAFLLAIPAVLGSGVFEAFKIGDDTNPAWGPTVLATVISFAVGYAVIAWLLKWITVHSYTPFVIYRVILGALLLVGLSTGFLSNPGS